MVSRSRVRMTALQLLFQHDLNPHVPRDAVEKFVRGRVGVNDLTTYCLRLYDGILAEAATVDAQLTAAADNWRLPRMAAVDRNVLRLATYELLKKKEPPNVVIDEAIELARRFGSAGSPAFVNGVLDRVKQLAQAPS